MASVPSDDSAQSDTVLVVHQMENRLPDSFCATQNTLRDVTIWGGTCFSWGESCVSRLVSIHRESLQRFIFLPEQIRGGRMIRSHYADASDRPSRMTFPSITTLGYYEDRDTPFDALWIVPNLEVLYVFQGQNSVEDILDRWTIDGDSDSNLAKRVLEQSPNLEKIICAKPVFSEPFLFETLRKITAPQPMSWECLCLLEVALKKEYTGVCPIAMLPAALMDHIVSFCHLSHWKMETKGDPGWVIDRF